MLDSPPTVVSIVPRKVKTERAEQSVLDAYIDQISLWSTQSTQSDSVLFEQTEVQVNAWIAKGIHRFCNSKVPRGEVEDLVTRGVAVIAKCRTELAYEPADPMNLGDVYSQQAEMMLSVAVGSVLVREMQKKCNELIAAGNNEETRELNQFQHSVRKAVQEVRNTLDEAEKERAKELAASLLPYDETPIGPAKGPVSLKLKIPASGGPARTRRRLLPKGAKAPVGAGARIAVPVYEPARRPSKFPRYASLLGALALLVASAVYVVLLFSVEPVQQDTSETLMAKIAGMPGVTIVHDRNPYVVLTVHADFWTASGKSQRTDWIKDLSQLVERHGYRGLLVRSSGGLPLAEWIIGRGVQFAEPS